MVSALESDQWVIRTDFSDDIQWSLICDLIAAPQKDGEEEFFAYVNYINDRKYCNKEPYDLIVSLPDNYPGMFCFLVDQECIQDPEHPILVVGFYPSDEKSFYRHPRTVPKDDMKTYRALPSQIQAIQNNLSIANVDFEDFANAVDDDNVLRR